MEFYDIIQFFNLIAFSKYDMNEKLQNAER
jgi:hypothetical protein